MEAKSMAGARLVALGVIAQKVVSTVLNQYILLEIVSAEAYGVASIRLELVLSTVLFLSRESFRLAVTRSGKANEITTLIAWIPAAFGVVLAAILYLCGEHIFQRGEEVKAFRLYCLAAALESVSEPAYCLALARLEALPRALAEPVAFFCRDLARALLMLSERCTPLEAFGYAQIGYALSLGLARFGAWRFLVPKEKQPSTWFPRLSLLKKQETKSILNITLLFAAQSLLKHGLTQADKAFLWRYVSKLDAGVYAKVENYGALICRVILQPVEEAARLALARTENESQAMSLFSTLLKGASYLALLFASIAAPYAGLAISILRGPRGISEDKASLYRRNFYTDTTKTEGPRLRLGLSAYCMLIPGLALNGIAEAFVHSRGNSANLSLLSLVHTATAFAFFALARFSMTLSAPDSLTAGLIYALALAYMLRVLCVLAICLYKREKKQSSFLPPKAVLFAFALAGITTRISCSYYYSTPALSVSAFVIHIATAVVSLLLVVFAAVHTDRAFLGRFLASSNSATRNADDKKKIS